MSSLKSTNLELIHEDDFVEYFLYPKIPQNVIENNDSDNLQNYLNNILTEINNFIEFIKKDYIWHKDEFKITIRSKYNQILIDEKCETNLNNKNNVDVLQQKEFPPHFYGISHYGDNIQDEWFIVYLIYEITKNFNSSSNNEYNIIGRVRDSDGEFLLIECADLLPSWANPETCEQRVFIYNGNLHVVQNSPSNTTSILPVSTGIHKIWENPKLYVVKNDVQKLIDSRLNDFNNYAFKDLFHNQIINVPLGVANILEKRPNLISAACRAFCERDQFDNKSLRAMKFFPPENRIRINVKFTRFLYAMILHQNYVPDGRIGWELTSKVGTDAYKEDILGIKIACGFEILATQAKNSSDNLEFNRDWNLYLDSLIKKGYFKDNIEGSEEYVHLFNSAKQFYCENLNRFRTRKIVGKEILHLLREVDHIEKLKQNNNFVRPSDNDSWLNITAEELNEMLKKKYGIKKFYSTNGNSDAAEFTSNIQEFLAKTSEFDGIDTERPTPPLRKKVTNKNPLIQKDNLARDKNNSFIASASPSASASASASTSDQINFDPDSFSTHVKNLLDFVIPEDNWDSNSDMDDYEDDEDLEKNISQMSSTEKLNIDANMKNYMEQMDKELANTTLAKTFVKSGDKDVEEGEEFDDIETFKPIDINVNTLKNMMESYKSQLGGSGPTRNLMSSLGIGFGGNGQETKPEQPEYCDLKETTN